MNIETPSRPNATSPDPKRAVRRAALGLLVVTGSVFAQAHAQIAPAVTREPATRSTLEIVLGRLDETASAVILIALLIIALLVWRIWLTVRRERPMETQARGPRTVQTRGDDEPIEHTTISRPTDWGADQNKRSAVGRARAPGAGRDADLPAIDHQATQWPPIELQNTAGRRVLSPDTLGLSPHAPPSPYRTGGFNPYYNIGRAENRIEVEEIADTLTQAELLVQLGDPKEAMSLLARNIRETEKPGPSVWLMLLGLYQSTGREAQYNALSEGFRTLFNADVPPWATSPDTVARNLESYPQVMKKLREIWPRPECRTFLEGLLNDDRGGSRQGFTLAAYRELLFLVEILETLEHQMKEKIDRIEIDRRLATER
ncbi:MAG: hypothetical protein ACR2GP_10545 [Burkholderiaceae bacterium]